MKYIIFKQGSYRMAVVFAEHITHSQIDILGGDAESAGFTEVDATGRWRTHGYSESLNLNSDPRDGELIQCSLAGGSLFYNGPCFDDSPLQPRIRDPRKVRPH